MFFERVMINNYSIPKISKNDGRNKNLEKTLFESIALCAFVLLSPRI